MWPFTGGCHYTLGCKKFYSECKLCPSINNLFFKDDSILNLFNKKISIFKNQNLHLVGINYFIKIKKILLILATIKLINIQKNLNSKWKKSDYLNLQ